MENPEPLLPILQALAQHAHSTPFKPAIVLRKRGQWQQFSYGDLAEETARWAEIWRGAAGSYQTSRPVVFIVTTHCMEMYPAFLGAMAAGLIPSFLPFPSNKQKPDLYWQAHRELFMRVRPACILTYGEIIPPLQDIVASFGCRVLDIATCNTAAAPTPLDGAADPSSVALLQHSSGTTGLKKGVALTFQQIKLHVSALREALAATTEDRIISWLPVYHDMGLISSFMFPLTIGATIISLDAFEWLMQPDSLFDDIERFSATLCWLPNFAFSHLERTRDPDRTYNLSSIRCFVDCSEPCKVETVERFHARFRSHGLREDAVQTCYGMAEIVFAATQSRGAGMPRAISVSRRHMDDHGHAVLTDRKQGDAVLFLSCGTPLPTIELRIVPDRAIDAAGSPIGEIQVRSPFLFEGYFLNNEATRAAFDGTWMKSGDNGFVLDGELYVCGRRKEMLIVHGRNFYANDIEEVVNRVPGIKPGRVVAVGVQNDSTGSEEAVVIAESILPAQSARASLTLAIRAAVLNDLDLALHQVQIADAGTLVKTTSGKLSRNENVRLFAREAL